MARWERSRYLPGWNLAKISSPSWGKPHQLQGPLEHCWCLADWRGREVFSLHFSGRCSVITAPFQAGAALAVPLSQLIVSALIFRGAEPTQGKGLWISCAPVPVAEPLPAPGLDCTQVTRATPV